MYFIIQIYTIPSTDKDSKTVDMKMNEDELHLMPT